MSFRGSRNVRHLCRHSLPGDQASSSALLAYSVRDSIGIPRVRALCVHSHACSIRSPRIRRTRHRKQRQRPLRQIAPDSDAWFILRPRIWILPPFTYEPVTGREGEKGFLKRTWYLVILFRKGRQEGRRRIFWRTWYYRYFTETKVYLWGSDRLKGGKIEISRRNWRCWYFSKIKKWQIEREKKDF